MNKRICYVHKTVVRKKKCHGLTKHGQCPRNSRDSYPSLKRRIQAMLYVPPKANLMPRMVTGTGDN